MCVYTSSYEVNLFCISLKEQANQTVPESLLSLAMQNPRFKKSRFNRAGGGGGGGEGGGARRPGLGRGRGGPGLGFTGSTSSGGARARPGFVGFSQVQDGRWLVDGVM